jgi:hypothetical protein
LAQTLAPLAGNRGFESTSLQQGVTCEPHRDEAAPLIGNFYIPPLKSHGTWHERQRPKVSCTFTMEDGRYHEAQPRMTRECCRAFLAYGINASIGRMTILSAKFTRNAAPFFHRVQTYPTDARATTIMLLPWCRIPKSRYTYALSLPVTARQIAVQLSRLSGTSIGKSSRRSGRPRRRHRQSKHSTPPS